jgi:hypothetical protein
MDGKLFSNAPPPDRTSEILGRHLDGDFVVYPMAEEPCTLDDLEKVAQLLSVEFPAEFAAHVCGRFPGIYVEVKEAVWPRAKAYDVGPFWSFLYGLHTYTPCATSADWMRLDHAAMKLREATGGFYVPILTIIGDADVYAIDADGAIVRYNHELNELSPIDGGFWTVFEDEISRLKKRKVRKISGE